ncbi:MAG: serine hydrolase [Bacteroidetes bacterium]|nr:MAG: serine hydrolase [Bacteroidota bacterium]
MKNFLKAILPIVLIAGCYSTIDKKPSEKAKEDSTSYYPPAPVTISKAEYRRYYRAAQEFYENELQSSHFNGQFLVAKKGQLIYEKNAGFERLYGKDTMSSHSPLQLASVSKTFTGMGILKLWEEGKLQISDEVSKYLIGFPYPGVTIKTLLNHRSGLPNYVHVMELLGWDKNRIVSNEDVLQFLIDNKKKLQVGTPNRGFSYCNTNFALLALIIERVSGKPYPVFMKETFFAPLQMNDTYVFTMSDSARAIPSYNWRNRQEAFTFLDAVYGDKNVFSTANDMLKWDNALVYGNLFKPATLDSAYSGYSYEKRGIKNYGLGWRMLEYPTGEKIIYHNGWWHGSNTVFARLLQDSATIIILGNRFDKNIYHAKKLFPVFGKYDAEEDTDE